MDTERQRPAEAETVHKLTPSERINVHFAELLNEFDPDSVSVESMDEIRAHAGRIATLLTDAHEGMMLAEQVRSWAETNPAYAKRTGIDPDAPLDDVVTAAYRLGMKRVDKNRKEKESKGAHQRRIRRDYAMTSRNCIRQLASYMLHEEEPERVDRFTARLKEEQDGLAKDSDNRQMPLTT